MGVVGWVVFDLVAGAVAKPLLPGRDPGGCIVAILLGIAGAFVGGFLHSLLTDVPLTAEFDLGSFAVAVAGAVVLLLLHRALTGRRA